MVGSGHDRPYVTERPDDLRRRWNQCVPAGVVRARTPDWHLQRWKAVRELIDNWYTDDRPDAEAVPDLLERLAGWLDPVQRSIVERVFAGWRAMFPRDPGVEVDLDPEAVSLFDHERSVELRVRPTFAFSHPDGTVEAVRLRTGMSSTGADDAAVLAVGSERTDVVYLDGMAALGVAEEIEAPERPGEIVGELFDLAVRDRRVPVSPGRWCFSCETAARCAQYPVIDGGRVYTSTRSVVVSKTNLGRLGVCERRVAWDRVHQIPADLDGDLELRRGLATGLRFHEMAAAAILAEVPASVVAASAAESAPSEAAELLRMWDNHLALWAEDGGPRPRSVEYSAGITLLVPGVNVDSRGRESTQPVAVTMIGILDVTGREPDGTPLVVEHRTGTSGEHGFLEAELYAASAAASVWAASGSWPDRLAVHLHHLGPERPTCDRREFDRDALRSAVDLLRQAAEVVAGWHPNDSLDPSWSAGPWCQGCTHEALCETFR